jgi:hypothetical protein
MFSNRQSLLVALVTGLLGACGGVDDGARTPDGGNPGGMCEGSTDCTDPAAPVCFEGQCVECAVSADCTTDPAAPVCDSGSLSCRACAEHDECGSLVCDRATGACIAEADVIYVDPAEGTNGAGCGGRAAPCGTVAQTDGALTKVGGSRTWIKLLNEELVFGGPVIEGGTVSLIGPGTLSADATLVDVAGASTVLIDEVSLIGQPGLVTPAIRCAGSSKIRVFRSVIRDNDGGGIAVQGCDLVVEESTIEDNGFGLDLNTFTLRLERSVIASNSGGGIRILGTDGAFTIRNNFIVNNGDGDTAESGGVHLGSTKPTDVFEHNTLSGNLNATGEPQAMTCFDTQLTSAGNIVHDGGTEPIASGLCVFEHSNVQGRAGGTNIDEDPLFVDPGGGDFHIQPDSPCVDQGDPASAVAEDFDGEVRPQGEAADIGADEVAGSAR